MRRFMVRRYLPVLLAGALIFAVSAAQAVDDRHVTVTLDVTLNSAPGSNVTGRVNVTSLPQGGTVVTVVARGLEPGEEYVSLYYENHTCDLEPYDEDDVIGRFTANAGGVGTVKRTVEENLVDINSISIRLYEALALQACADVHP
jgi:hypothetical protein